MVKPLIGITGRRWPTSRLADYLPTSYADASFDLHLTEYGAAVAEAGGLPVELTRDAPADEIVERLDGVVIPGGADVDPARYGEEPHAETHAEPDRDEFELAILEAALRRELPVLAICRGMQLVNVYFGGTLHQHVDLESGDGHPNFDPHRSTHCHTVRISRGSLASELYGPTQSVNSLHHQTVARLGDGLVATGWSPDGTIEVLERPDCALFAVQWHPEALSSRDPSFRWLIETAIARSALAKVSIKPCN